MRYLVFFIVLLTTISSYADIGKKEELEQTIHVKQSISEITGDEDYYDEELEEAKRKLAYEAIEEIIITKAKETPIGQYVERRIKIMSSYFDIEYSKKVGEKKPQVLLPGQQKSEKVDYKIQLRLIPDIDIEEQKLFFDLGIEGKYDGIVLETIYTIDEKITLDICYNSLIGTEVEYLLDEQETRIKLYMIIKF